MKRVAFAIILGAVFLVVGSGSYWIGRDRALEASASRGVIGANTAPPTDTLAEPLESRPSTELALLKEKLKLSYTNCPSAEHDWILRGQTAAILSTMTTAELKALLDELVAHLKKRSRVSLDDPNGVLVRDILREWCRKDPVAACTASIDGFQLAAGRIAAFQDWLLREPRAVERWMNSGGDAVPAELRKAWLAERVKSDPYDAIQQLTKLTPDQREASLLEWSISFALLTGERKALLDAVRDDPAMMKKCAGKIAGALADRSVEEAYQFVDSLKLDESAATSLDDGIFIKWAMQDPQEAFAAWAAQKQDRLPEFFLHAMSSWSMNSPGAEQAIKWLDSVQPGQAKEKIQVYFIERLTSGDRYRQALAMGIAMENREEGKRQVQRTVAVWKEKFPGDEKEWAQILREGGMKVE